MRKDNGKRTGMQKLLGVEKLGSYVIHFPELGRKLGSQNAAVVLEYLLGWEGKQKNKDRWIFKTIDEFEFETGLSRSQQDGAIRVLREFGFIEVRVFGIPATRHFRLLMKPLQQWWIALAYPIEHKPVEGNSSELLVDNQQTNPSATKHDTASTTGEALTRTGDQFKHVHRALMEEGIRKAKEEQRILREEQERQSKSTNNPNTSIPSGDNPTISGTS